MSPAEWAFLFVFLFGVCVCVCTAVNFTVQQQAGRLPDSATITFTIKQKLLLQTICEETNSESNVISKDCLLWLSYLFT